MKFDWEKFKSKNIAVSFDRKEDVYDFAHEATRNGIVNAEDYVEKWIRLVNTGFVNNGETIVFHYFDNDFLDWGVSSSEYYNNFTIVKWVVYPKLEEGMIIEVADEQDPFWYIRKVKEELIATNNKEWFYLKYYDDNLMNKVCSSLNIMKIYKSNSFTLNGLFSKENLVLIWERKEEVEEMTLEEICKALGKKIKIKED